MNSHNILIKPSLCALLSLGMIGALSAQAPTLVDLNSGPVERKGILRNPVTGSESSNISSYTSRTSNSNAAPATYTFGQGTGVDRTLESFDYLAEDGTTRTGFDVVDFAPEVTVQRKGPGSAFTPGYETIAETDTARRTFTGSEFANEDAVLTSGFVNVGVRNAFSNQSSDVTRSNIERIDFVWDVSLSAKDTGDLESGFLFTDVGNRGVNGMALAAITGIDSSGNPTSYKNQIVYWDVAVGDIGGADDDVDVGEIFEDADLGRFNYLTQNVGSSTTTDDPFYNRGDDAGVTGRLVTLDQLGLSVDEIFYGISAFAPDTRRYLTDNNVNVNDPTNGLVNISGAAFPTDTDDTDGDPDFTGPSGFLAGDGTIINPEPGLALAPLALLLCLFNRRLARRLLD